MARYNFCVILTVCTLLTNGTAYALLRIRVILAVAFAVSGVVSNNLALGACVWIRFCVVYILAFSEVAFLFRRATIPHYTNQLSRFEVMTHRGGEVARVETNGNMVEFEGVSSSINTRNDRLAIVNISWCRVCINDNTVTPIYDAMV